MRLLAASLVVLMLSGCAVVDKVKDYWPRDHDPALVSAYINLERELEVASCSNQLSMMSVVSIADWMSRYTQFRNDPQKIAAKNVKDNLEKAANSSEAACNRYLNLTKINMKLIKESWSGR